MSNYYLPSGKFSSSSLLYFSLLSITAFPILGLIYAYCIWYIPFIYINFIIAGAVGFAIGFLINTFVIGKGKVRNVAVAVILGLLGGIIALYFHWAVWVDLVINAGESYGGSRIGVTVSNIKILQVFSLVIQPDILFSLITEINETGTWGIRGASVSGIFLSIIWIIELLIVVGVSTLISFPRSKQPFCEKDNAWFKEIELDAFQYFPNTSEIITELESKKSEHIESAKLAKDQTTNHSILTLYTSNFGESFLSIENKKAKTDKDGKLDFDSHLFLEYIAISKSIKDIILNKKKTFEDEKSN